LAAPTVSSLVGARVFPVAAPQGVVRPFVILRLVSAAPHHTHGDAPAELLEAARVQVDCYGSEYAATHALAQAADDVLGVLTGPPISVTRKGQSDAYENETSLYVVSSDYMVQRVRG
jgi:hypothetical protein